MMLIEQSPVDLRLANQWADQCFTNLKKTPNYTGLSSPDRFYVGYRGELAVEAWFRRIGQKYDFEVVTDGESQDSEFHITFDNGDKWSVEVKTASEPHHKKLMMPIVQKQDFIVLIGVRLESPTEARIMGWLMRVVWQSIMKCEQIRIPTYTYPLEGLCPPEQWPRENIEQ